MLTTTFLMFFFLTLLNLYNAINGISSFWFIQVVIAFSFPVRVYIYDFLIAAIWTLSWDVLDNSNSRWPQ